jgi:hypothetical protein
MLASAQVHPGRIVRVRIYGPSQLRFRAHLPIVCCRTITCKVPRLGPHADAAECHVGGGSDGAMRRAPVDMKSGQATRLEC